MVSSCTTVMYPEKESDMSFSSEGKEELAKHISPARHCQIAELAALMNFSGQYGRSAEGDFMIGFQTENEAVVRKGFTLLKKTYNIDTDVKISEEQMRSVIDKIGDLSEPVSPLLIKNSCCQRAFLRGAFLCIGSMSDPQKSYELMGFLRFGVSVVDLRYNGRSYQMMLPSIKSPYLDKVFVGCYKYNI